jgi:hypothetical protein
MATQLEIKSGNPLKIRGKGGTSGKHRRKETADLAKISEFSIFIFMHVPSVFLKISSFL